MFLAAKAFRIDLVNLFGARRTSRKPATLSNHFHPADGLAISGRMRENGLNLLPRQTRALDAFLTQLRQNRFLLGGRMGIGSVILRITVFCVSSR